MEDAHTVRMSLSETNPRHRFFGVFDGHSGAAVAEWSSKHIATHIESSAHFDEKSYEKALKDGFVSLDRELKRNAIIGGSTGVTLLITPEGELHCANVGDSRCVACEGGKAVDLSIDHKPTLPAEHDRILRAGGFVANGRVMGSLAMSRALGDFTFKVNQRGNPEDDMVTALPEVISARLTADTEFIILACDGIWDCVTSQQCVDFVRRWLQQAPDMPLSSVSAEIFKSIISPRPFGLGCDNMSMLILQLKSPPLISASSQPASSGSGVLLDDMADVDDDIILVEGDGDTSTTQRSGGGDHCDNPTSTVPTQQQPQDTG